MSQATEVYSREIDLTYLSLPVSLRLWVEGKIRDLGGRLHDYPHIRLQGREEFKLRVGDYRIIYDFDPVLNELYLLAIGQRREVYR